MLLLSGIFLCIAPGSAFVYLGLFLFNMAMPLTLSTVILSFPGRTGFSFGLTTLALLIGVLPYTLIPREWAASPWYLAILVLLAALGLFFGLDPNRKKKQPLADPLAPSGQMPPIPAEPCAKPNWYETDASENKSADPSKKNSECHG